MARQADYVRYTIRVPAGLYERIQEAAGDKSVNAEIIERLEASFNNLKQELAYYRDRELELHREIASLKKALSERSEAQPEERAAASRDDAKHAYGAATVGGVGKVEAELAEMREAMKRMGEELAKLAQQKGGDASERDVFQAIERGKGRRRAEKD